MLRAGFAGGFTFLRQACENGNMFFAFKGGVQDVPGLGQSFGISNLPSQPGPDESVVQSHVLLRDFSENSLDVFLFLFKGPSESLALKIRQSIKLSRQVGDLQSYLVRHPWIGAATDSRIAVNYR